MLKSHQFAYYEIGLLCFHVPNAGINLTKKNQYFSKEE